MGRRCQGAIGRAVVALALLLLASGCSQDNKRPAAGDPLVGGGAPLGGLGGPAPKTATAIVAPLPPLSAPASSASTAALAAAPAVTLDPAHDLRIGPPPSGVGATLTGNPGISTVPTNAGGWQPPRTTPGHPDDTVPSTAPIAITPPMVVPHSDAIQPPPSRRDVTLTGGNAPPAVTRVQSFEQAEAALRGRNVVWQDLKSYAESGEWRFSCSVPSRQNPAQSRTYEGRATNPLAAIQAVLDKIDGDQATGY